MFNTHTALMIAACAIGTMVTRALPFVIWSGERKTPPYILWLGNVLPYAIMAMLVVYCLRNVDFGTTSSYVPAAISVVVTGGIQAWKRDSIMSIIVGTVCYMVLIQVI